MLQISMARGEIVLIDECDLNKLQGLNWSLNNYGYAVARVKGKHFLMHRLIACPKEGQQVDHINGNRQDNRSQNLRLCTHAENMRNRATHKNNQLGIKGVYLERRTGRMPVYRVQIRVSNKKIYLGRFTHLDDAAAAYAEAALKYHGVFARQ